MFHLRKLNNRIKRIHERDKDNSVTVYHENLELLDTEKLKVKKNLDGRSLLV